MSELREKHIYQLMNNFAGSKPKWDKGMSKKQASAFHLMATTNGWNGTLNQQEVSNFMRGVYNRFLEKFEFDGELMDYLEFLYCWQKDENFNFWRTHCFQSKMDDWRKASHIFLNGVASVCMVAFTAFAIIKLIF